MKTFALALALVLAPFALQAEDTPKDAGQGGMGMDKGGRGMGKGAMMGLMTEQERKEHMEKMHSMKDRDQCAAYMKDHHKAMQERADAKGLKMPDMKGDDSMCAKMAKAPAPAK